MLSVYFYFDPTVKPNHHSLDMQSMSSEIGFDIDHLKWQAMLFCLVNYDTSCQSSGEQDMCPNNALAMNKGK